MFSELISILPFKRGNNPKMDLMSVLFPEPFFPAKPTSSPFFTTAEIPEQTAWEYSTERFLIWMNSLFISVNLNRIMFSVHQNAHHNRRSDERSNDVNR